MTRKELKRRIKNKNILFKPKTLKILKWFSVFFMKKSYIFVVDNSIKIL